MFNFRTDLASERRDIFKKANSIENEINGIESEKEELSENISVERVKITNEEGQNAIGKPIGNYITMDIKQLRIAQDEDIEKSSEILSNELKKIIDSHIDKQGEIIVVGLGNIYVRSDKTYNKLSATICRRRNKNGKCYITRSAWNNRNRDIRDFKRNR